MNFIFDSTFQTMIAASGLAIALWLVVLIAFIAGLYFLVRSAQLSEARMGAPSSMPSTSGRTP